MKYSATALCRTLISLDFQSSRYWLRILSTHFFNLRAVSYFCQSFSPCRDNHKKKNHDSSCLCLKTVVWRWWTIWSTFSRHPCGRFTDIIPFFPLLLLISEVLRKKSIQDYIKQAAESQKEESTVWVLHKEKKSFPKAYLALRNSLHNFRQTITLILELGFNMIYLIDPWMFSVHDTSQVTLLSCRTSFHLCPGGGGGTLESLHKAKYIEGKK